jgi:zinc protease
MALVQEMLFEPRWDANEFDTLKNQVSQAITQAEGNPNALARRELAELRYPQNSPLHHAGGTGYGGADALSSVGLEDLKAFHAAYYTLEGASLRLAGDYDTNRVKSIWDKAEIGPDTAAKTPAKSSLAAVSEGQIYFYDVPGAKQSVLRLSRPALAATDADYPLAEALNFPLGGIYTSKLNTQLRVEKGYTYGIRSGFNGGKDNGTFAVSSSVRSNVTKESLDLIRSILASHGPETTEEDLALLKDALLRGQALKTETLGDKLSMLGEIDAYGYAPDFRAQNAKAINAMTLADFQRIAAEHIRPDAMQYLVVGDAATQLEAVKSLGLPVEEIR